MRVDKALGLVLFVLGLNATVAVFVLYFAFFYENPPVTYLGLPFQTQKAIYQPGEDVKVFGGVCRNTDAPFTRYVEFRNTEVVFLPPIERGGRTKGCVEQMLISIGKLPTHFPPSENVTAWGKTVYHVRFGQRVAEWYTTPFTVTANEDQ